MGKIIEKPAKYIQSKSRLIKKLREEEHIRDLEEEVKYFTNQEDDEVYHKGQLDEAYRVKRSYSK